MEKIGSRHILAGGHRAVLLDHWRFPMDVSEAICTHVRPETAGEFSAGAANLHLACAVTAEWGQALPGESTAWRRDDSLCGLAGLDADQLEGALADARRQFDHFTAIEWPKAA